MIRLVLSAKETGGRMHEKERRRLVVQLRMLVGVSGVSGHV